MRTGIQRRVRAERKPGDTGRTGRRELSLLMGTVLLLVTIGLVVLSSAGSVRGESLAGDPAYFVKRQAAWLVLGLFAAWFAYRLPYRHWRRMARPLTLTAMALLVLVLFIGPKIGGSRRWLRAGEVAVQPAELAKFAAVVAIAAWIARTPLRTQRYKEGLLIPGAILLILVLLVLVEPDVGTAVLMGAVGGVLLFVSGFRTRPLLLVGLAGALVIGVYVRMDPVRWRRVEAWLWPERYPAISYHFLESRNAFILGGTSIQPGRSIQKHHYLPEPHTDFIFAILGEEFGLWGTELVVLLFGLFLVCGARISRRAPDLFGGLLAFGITLSITLQAMFNIAVVTGALPTKGITLPFFSYGGSSLVISFLQVGVLLNIGRQALDRDPLEPPAADRVFGN
ncbi:MAG: putative lipid II flippase FtsW [Verrucomicrobia bacterium]|nr:putative lipid II flippase FtsW [Verrucomicrobiota bacterium]MBU1910200.1 putative lipid II flippase FtsW [Verrucomicrobiota bacterium]